VKKVTDPDPYPAPDHDQAPDQEKAPDPELAPEGPGSSDHLRKIKVPDPAPDPELAPDPERLRLRIKPLLYLVGYNRDLV
jgi:hypothetical protein